MEQFHLQIVAPDELIFDGQAYMISCMGIEGSMSVLANHVSLVTSLKEGDIRIYEKSETESKEGTSSGGVLSISKDCVRLLAADFKWKQ